MHPAMAWWMWSMAMTRVCHDPLSDFDGLPDTQTRVAGVQRGEFNSARAGRDLTTDVINRPLADSARGRLADLHWMESEPGLAA
jgi:hypothetical protein